MRAGVGLTVALAVCAPAPGATYVVSPRGRDTNPGSAAAPFRTIGAATAVVKAGDTIQVKAGTYAGGIGLVKTGTADRPVVLKADGDVRVVGRIAPVRGFQRAKGLELTYVADEPGPVVSVAIDLDTTKLVIDAPQAVATPAEVDAGNYRCFYDKAALRLYVRYLRDNPERKHTIHVLRDPYGLNVGGAHVVVDGLTLTGFAGHGIHGVLERVPRRVVDVNQHRRRDSPGQEGVVIADDVLPLLRLAPAERCESPQPPDSEQLPREPQAGGMVERVPVVVQDHVPPTHHVQHDHLRRGCLGGMLRIVAGAHGELAGRYVHHLRAVICDDHRLGFAGAGEKQAGKQDQGQREGGTGKRAHTAQTPSCG